LPSLVRNYFVFYPFLFKTFWPKKNLSLRINHFRGNFYSLTGKKAKKATRANVEIGSMFLAIFPRKYTVRRQIIFSDRWLEVCNRDYVKAKLTLHTFTFKSAMQIHLTFTCTIRFSFFRSRIQSIYQQTVLLSETRYGQIHWFSFQNFLKLISSPYRAGSAPNCLWASHDGM